MRCGESGVARLVASEPGSNSPISVFPSYRRVFGFPLTSGVDVVDDTKIVQDPA
jgi:hypothetical protein